MKKVDDAEMGAHVEEEPVPMDIVEPPPRDKMEALRQVMVNCGSFDTSHPFLPLIDSDRTHPYLTFLKRLCLMVEYDKLSETSYCEWCYFDKDCKNPERSHRHYSEHVWTCELKHNPGTWKCPICAALVLCVPLKNNTLSEPESDYLNKQLDGHRKKCLKVVFAISAAQTKAPGAVQDDDGDLFGDDEFVSHQAQQAASEAKKT